MGAERGGGSGLFPGPDGWSLAPEGAAVHCGERTAVIADVHLGYEWARGSGGDCVPAHSLAETLGRLERLLRRTPIARLVVAGDLVESPAPCPRTAADVRSLTRWLAGRGVAATFLAGNHDSQRAPAPAPTDEVGGWTIGHGHRPIAAPRSITGHIHPVLRAGGTSAACFLVGPRTIVLPAFSANAAGWNVAAGLRLPHPDRGEPLRCVAASSDELLDFGPLATLASRLGSLGPGA